MNTQKGGAIVDLGNVIIAHWIGEPTTSENFERVYHTKPEVPGVFESLRKLNEIFGGNVTVVYKASDAADEKIFTWLSNHRFTELTGIPFSRVHRTLNGRDKTAYLEQSSATHHGTTVVVDDRLEVLSFFVGKVQNLFLFHPQTQEVGDFCHTGALNHVHVVQTWKEIEERLKI